MDDPHPHTESDIAIIGTALAGRIAGLAMARAGAQVASIGPALDAAGTARDRRTTALLGASVRVLQNLGLWAACEPRAAPLKTLRIIDDTGRLLRAPTLEFEASEIGADAFGYNIPNAVLLESAQSRAAALENIRTVATERATAVEPNAESVRIRLREGQVHSARLVIGADGRESICRAAAGITATAWRYDQSAIACNFRHTLPHGDACTELHRPAGPFTVVPLPGRESSLVWVERPGEVRRLLDLPDDAFAREIEERLQGLLGAVTGVTPRAAFPLSGLTVREFARRRIALIGEAAHVIPPIGAQGLNLGLRDIAALAEGVTQALAAGGDPGSLPVLRAYNDSRRADVLSRTAAVDILNRSLLSGLVPIQAMRGVALHALGALGPLRRFVMRQGVSPTGRLPSLMR